ncbi:MAG TPA: hypothetical protein VLM87_08915, partial [Rubrivivax sp.]|nr:hypothetical protein [Rubrivivax sp.]
MQKFLHWRLLVWVAARRGTEAPQGCSMVGRGREAGVTIACRFGARAACHRTVASGHQHADMHPLSSEDLVVDDFLPAR